MLVKTFVPAIALVASALASNVIDLTPSNFDAEVFSGTPSLVEFFAPWCGHCKKLAPTYEELADSLLASKSKVKIAKVDADEHKSLGTKFGITGFPTIKYFDGQSKEPQDYTGGRDLQSFQKWIQEKSGARAKKVIKPPSEIKHLTDKTFDKAVGGGVYCAMVRVDLQFVALTNYRHCKTLAPVWESLAADFAGDKELVTIAKVDAEAEQAVAKAQGISSYPTIKYFPKGSTDSLAYNGERDLPALVAYVNEQAGTYRKPGGTLDVAAGTFEALDQLVHNISGKDLDTVTKDVNTAIKNIKDKGVEYYVKVLEKLKQNTGYVEKESSRLEGLLAKGGLAKSKQDDLTRRLNVLKRFLKGEASAQEVKEEL